MPKMIDPLALEAAARVALANIAVEIKALVSHRNEYSPEGLAMRVEQIQSKHAPALQKVAADIDTLEKAIEAMPEFWHAQAYPPLPTGGADRLAVEMEVTRLMARPAPGSAESIRAMLPTLWGTPTAAVYVDEVKVRDETAALTIVTVEAEQDSWREMETVKAALTTHLSNVLAHLRREAVEAATGEAIKEALRAGGGAPAFLDDTAALVSGDAILTRGERVYDTGKYAYEKEGEVNR